MKHLILSALLFSLATVAAAQNVKIKKDEVSIDGTTMLKIEDDASTRGSFYLIDLKDNHLLYFKWVYADGFNYFEIYSPDDLDNILFEEQATTNFKKHTIKVLYNAKVVSADGLNDEKLAVHAKKMGKEFTRKREEMRK